MGHTTSQWAFAIRPSSRESTKHCSSIQWLTSTPTAASAGCSQHQLSGSLRTWWNIRTRTLVEYICTYFGYTYTEDCDWGYHILGARCFHSSVCEVFVKCLFYLSRTNAVGCRSSQTRSRLFWIYSIFTNSLTGNCKTCSFKFADYHFDIITSF